MSPLTYFTNVPAGHLQRVHTLESAGYPEDEAASRDSLVMRLGKVNKYFLGAYTTPDFQENSLVGYLCCTISRGETLTHDSMTTHEPEGDLLCIHSVCVDEKYRRQGIALAMLKEFLRRVQADEASPLKRIALMAKKGICPLYQKAGFTLVGLSDITHGKDPWYELVYDIRRE